MATRRIRILDPAGGSRQAAAGIAERASTVSGKVLGLLSNGWRSFDDLVERYGDLAKAKYEASGVVSRKNPNASSGTPKPTLEELVTVDAAVVGIGH